MGHDVDMERDLGPTRPLEQNVALDQALGEAVERMRNEPTVAKECFTAMREALTTSRDPLACVALLRKLTATALSSWTPPTIDPDAFKRAADQAGFVVARYPAGKLEGGPVVVREPSYKTALDRPLLKSIARSFCVDVLAPALAHLRTLELDGPTKAFVDGFPELVRAGSLEAPTSPKLPPTSRFAIATALDT
jgi:hypothetical protein